MQLVRLAVECNAGNPSSGRRHPSRRTMVLARLNREVEKPTYGRKYELPGAVHPNEAEMIGASRVLTSMSVRTNESYRSRQYSLAAQPILLQNIGIQ